MRIAIAFDIYGTLIDTHGVITLLESMIGDRANEFSQYWRNKQLEYSFRRGLMNAYQNFSVCTRDSLLYTGRHFDIDLSDDAVQQLMASYSRLPAFPDAKPELQQMQSSEFICYAFSNGTRGAVAGLLEHAGLRDYMRDIISVDEIQTFKPNPACYQHFMTRSGSDIENSWLISSNPFDVLGALNAGMKAAWIQRSKANVFDPWDTEPTLTCDSLNGLSRAILGYYA